jgi:osmotically-inducible protein OsmY
MPKPAADPIENHSQPRRIINSSRSRRSGDEILRKSIRAHLHGPYKNVNVDVRDGFVTLEGAVRSFRLKELLHRFVMSLRAVRALKDLLRVNPIETVADKKIAQYIRQALDAHAELPRGTAAIHVADGVATLKGNVRSAEERFLAENVASHCRGVTRVINDLHVDPLEEVSDEATARAVRGALIYSDDFETDGVTVSCADGQICLRGEVPTMLDRALCEELARIQAGVRSVENLILVNAT